jgi:hypothetical protein
VPSVEQHRTAETARYLLGSSLVRRAHLVWLLLVLSACPGSAGGEYAKSSRGGGDVDRGEVNGRMFDFVSNKPDDDDWQIRIRGSSMWASYSHEDTSDDLGTVNLDAKETKKIWKLIDGVNIAERKKGKKDVDEGYVQLRLREPGGEEGHDIFSVYVSRATEDEEVIALAEYLQTLIRKYHKEKPNF